MRQLFLLNRHHRDNELDLIVNQNGRRAGIAVLAILDPHLRSEHQKRNFVPVSNADTGSADILLEHAGAFELTRCFLVKRHCIIFQDI